MAHYDVARMTARQAIQELRAEGRVVAEQGRGVFVRLPAPVRRLASDRFARRHREAGQAAFLAEAEKAGVMPRVDQVEVSRAAVPESVRERLKLAEGEEAVVRSRRYLADGLPIETAVSYIPPTSPWASPWTSPRAPASPSRTPGRAASTPACRRPATSSPGSPRRSARACRPPTNDAACSSAAVRLCSPCCAPPTAPTAVPSKCATPSRPPHAYVLGGAVTDAAVHDSRQLNGLLHRGDTSQRLFGDSAYRSAATEATLKERGFRSRIHVRATRGRLLSKVKAAANRAKSRIRARVEHVFGAQESAPGGRIVRTIGIVRARLKIGLQNFVYNVRRLATLERMAAA